MEKENLTKNIRQAIKNSKFTQRELCKHADINYDLFTQYLGVRKRNIPSDWIRRIALSLNVTTDSLYGISLTVSNDTKQKAS